MELQNNNFDSTKGITKKINVGKFYKHYSGKIYKVIAISRDSENPNLLYVIYQGLHNCATFGENPIWNRPYNMFAENLIIDGKEQARFEEIDLCD